MAKTISIKERLYYGDINPSKKVELVLEDEIEMRQQYHAKYEEFCKTLNESQLKKFEELMDVNTDVQDCYCLAYYWNGIQFGMELMYELLESKLSESK